MSLNFSLLPAQPLSRKAPLVKQESFQAPDVLAEGTWPQKWPLRVHSPAWGGRAGPGALTPGTLPSVEVRKPARPTPRTAAPSLPPEPAPRPEGSNLISCWASLVRQGGAPPGGGWHVSGHLSPGRQVGWDPQVPVSWDFPSLPQGRHWSSSDGLGSGLPEAEILICDSSIPRFGPGGVSTSGPSPV